MAYERIVAAAMKGESSLWEVADEVLREVPLRVDAQSPYHDGSRKKIKDIADVLESKGLDKYSEITLAKMRTTANLFGKANRVPSLSFTVHLEAGSPHILGEVVKASAVEKCDVSAKFVKKVKKDIEAEEKGARREAYKEAEAARKEAREEEKRAREDKRKANSKESKAAAEKREQEAAERAKEAALLARQLKTAPKVNHNVPPKSRANSPMMVVRTKFAADLSKAKSLVEKMDKDVDPHIDNLPDTFIDMAAEELLEVAELFRQLSFKVRARKTNKRSHLHAVGE